MKKQILAGIVVVLVMFFVTCDEFDPFNLLEEKVEYTDVEYSEDGSTVTVYLDGVGVPVTKSQRAITRDLAKMAYDYFEVVFIGKTPGTSQIVARAQWELGQSAGISGVERGVDYRWNSLGTHVTSSTPAATDVQKVALMFVGRKDDKTLLGVGQIAEVDHSAKLPTGTNPKDWADAITATTIGTPGPNDLPAYGTFVSGVTSGSLPNTVYAYISSNSTSITFYVEAIKTGLLIDKEHVKGGDPLPSGTPVYTDEHDSILTDSFNFTGDGVMTPITGKGYENRVKHSKRQNPGNGNTDYPIYSLPEDFNSVQLAEYAFKGAAVKNLDGASHASGATVPANPISFANGIKYYADVVTGSSAPFAPGDGIAIERRFPRYLVGGRYLQLKQNVDTDTTVVIDTETTNYSGVNGGGSNPYVAAIAAGASLEPVIPLKFTTLGSGVFSFYIEIPVYMLTTAPGTNSGTLEPITWKLRTGLGSELYSLDSGKSSGGCVLMGIGDIDLDWLEIYWEWLK